MLNISDFSLIWKLDPGRYISDIVFTKDGSHLISCSPGGLVEMRDIATGSSLGSIIPQQEGVRSLSLSAHGEYFAVLDYSGTTTIWDVATGKKVQDNNGKSSPGA
jgi:WD40 repeat protein